MDMKIIYITAGHFIHFMNKISFGLKKDNKKVIVFNTAQNTENLGDYIIMKYCNYMIDELFNNYDNFHVSTHIIPDQQYEKCIKETKYKLVCGTNLLTSHIEKWWNWRLPDGLIKKLKYKNTILLGVGWGVYQDDCSVYTKTIYKSILNPRIIHSVRDSYTETKLKKAGIYNVVNTGCPTMWRLTPEFCKNIPTGKSPDVITTITDYRRDIKNDNLMIRILSKNYNNVYLWLQGESDFEYLQALNIPDNVVFISHDLKSYEDMLNKGSVDYVGTRLHAGIHALNYKIRSIIIAVDNRAIEISKDTNLPIILRDRIKYDLENKINSIFSCDIKINTDNIKLFKNQFK